MREPIERWFYDEESDEIIVGVYDLIELEAYTERLEKALKEIVLESSDLGVYAIALKALEEEEK